jgi:hypothetical protein
VEPQCDATKAEAKMVLKDYQSRIPYEAMENANWAELLNQPPSAWKRTFQSLKTFWQNLRNALCP